MTTESERLAQATLDALSAHIAVLDEAGVIIAVNHAWRAFAEANPPLSSPVNEGTNYLAVCDAARGPDSAEAAAAASQIRAVMAGTESEIEIEYPCHSPEIKRWFVCRVSHFQGSGAPRIVVAHENITMRKQAEHDLQASETRYRRLFESAKDGILILDAATGQIVDVNPFMIILLGYTREEFVGKYLWEIGLFKDIAASKESFLELQAKSYVRYEDLPLEARDGRRIPVEFVSNTYLVNQREVIQCNIRDITERKRADASLKFSSAILSNMTEGVSLVGLDDGIIKFANTRFEQMFGYDAGELVGKDVSVINAPATKSPEETKREILTTLGQTCEWHGDIENIRKDGTRFWCYANISLLEHHGFGKVCINVHTDITARKQAEETLRASEQEFRTLAESMPQIVWATRADGWNIYFNQRWMDYTGLTLEQSYGHGWNTPFHPEDKQRAWEAWQRATQHNETYSVECRLRRADGAYRWWLIRGLPVRNPSGEILKWFGTCTDIDDIKRSEKKQEELQAQLLQSQKLESIGTLAGGVAHEINNPTMAIMNYAQLIVDQLGPDGPVTEYAIEIGKETQRVATIVKNLLSFARQDEGTHKSPAGLCDIVEDTLSLIRAVMRHDQITLKVNVPAGLPKILCRSQQIRQVIMNLLTNARDALNQKYPGYNDDKVIVVSAEYPKSEVGNRKSEGFERGSEETIPTHGIPDSDTPRSDFRVPLWIRLTVEDHGTGIPQDLRERIFNPFFSTKPRHKGTGLGLSISHGIVRDHGGTLSVESEVGQWTRFHVDLPVMDGAQ